MASSDDDRWGSLPKLARKPSQRVPAPKEGFSPLVPEHAEDLERRDRRAPDPWRTWSRALTAASASAAGIAVILLGMSSPPSHYLFFDSTFGAPSRSGWNEDGVTYAAVSACLCFAFAVGALVLRSQRTRRERDTAPVGLVVLMVLSLLAVAGYLLAGLA